MENLVKTMENGVIFYLRGTTCYDMNIPDNVKELILECDGMNAVSMRRLNYPTRLTSDGDSTGWRP